MVSGIRMICHQIPSVSADTRLAFPHPQVVAGRRAFKKSEIIGVVPAEGQPHSSTQRACPLLAKMQTGDFIDFNLLLVPGCWQPPTTASMLSDGWKEPHPLTEGLGWWGDPRTQKEVNLKEIGLQNPS